MIQPTTPYMLRKDGKLLECGSVHPYLKSFGVDDIDNLLEIDDLDLQWYYDNSNQEIKDAVVDFRKNKTINNLNKLNELVNNEFCKVRTSNHKYAYRSNDGEIYFRLCNTDNFNWYDVIWDVVALEKDYIKTVTIMYDFETFGKQYKYCSVKGKEIKHMPVDEFLTMQGNPVLEGLEEPTKEEISEIENKIIKSLVRVNPQIGNNQNCIVTTLNFLASKLNIKNMGLILYAALRLVQKEPETYEIWQFIKDDGEKMFFFYNKNVSSISIAQINAAGGIPGFYEKNKGYKAANFKKLNPDDYLLSEKLNEVIDTEKLSNEGYINSVKNIIRADFNEYGNENYRHAALNIDDIAAQIAVPGITDTDENYAVILKAMLLLSTIDSERFAVYKIKNMKNLTIEGLGQKFYIVNVTNRWFRENKHPLDIAFEDWFKDVVFSDGVRVEYINPTEWID